MNLRQLHDRAPVRHGKEEEKTEGDLFIPDPAKVVRSAPQNAASVAGLLLTTEALIAERPKKEAPAAVGGYDDGSDGGY